MDQYVLEIDDLDVNLGMDWLGNYEARIVCKNEKVNMLRPIGEKVT